MKKTALHSHHLEQNAKMIDFAGWDMPLHYGSQIQEHKHVRQDAGMFDVSHMTCLEIAGDDATDFLRKLLSGDVMRLSDGQGLYCCMLNERGGILDDLIIYKQNKSSYRMVVNAATTEKDLAWIQSKAKEMFPSVIVRAYENTCILAVQGPKAVEKFCSALPEYAQAADIPRFGFITIDDLILVRTGYTGEDGYEIIAPTEKGVSLWEKLLDAGVHPCGLGARDTLRLEYGMSLYGQDLDEEHTPLESALGWATHRDDTTRQFIGREAVEQQLAAGLSKKIVGLQLRGGIIRSGNKVVTNEGEGVITSGGFSPVLNCSIALARVPKKATEYQIEIRGELRSVETVKPPFLKKKAADSSAGN